MALGLARSDINHFSGSPFWHHNPNVLLWSDPAFNEGLCRHSKLHPAAIQNNVQPRCAQDSDLSPTQWFLLGLQCCFQGLTLQQQKLRQGGILFSECHAKPFFPTVTLKKKKLKRHILENSLPNLTKAVRKRSHRRIMWIGWNYTMLVSDLVRLPLPSVAFGSDAKWGSINRSVFGGRFNCAPSIS